MEKKKKKGRKKKKKKTNQRENPKGLFGEKAVTARTQDKYPESPQRKDRSIVLARERDSIANRKKKKKQQKQKQKK